MRVGVKSLSQSGIEPRSARTITGQVVAPLRSLPLIGTHFLTAYHILQITLLKPKAVLLFKIMEKARVCSNLVIGLPIDNFTYVNCN